ncbi:uncharacterized [Tachysurus ichikawai]
MDIQERRLMSTAYVAHSICRLLTPKSGRYEKGRPWHSGKDTENPPNPLKTLCSTSVLSHLKKQRSGKRSRPRNPAQYQWIRGQAPLCVILCSPLELYNSLNRDQLGPPGPQGTDNQTD